LSNDTHLTHKTCAKCALSKPIKSYKYKLTYAQTIARGHIGNYRLDAVSKYCHECRPKPKPLIKKSYRQIEEMVIDGAIKPAIAEAHLRYRAERKKQRLSRVRKKTWNKLFAQRWGELLKPVRAEIRKLNTTLKRISNRPHLTEYCITCLAILEDVRDTMAYRKDEGDRDIPYEDWREAFSQTHLQSMRDAWVAVPQSERGFISVNEILKGKLNG